MPIPDFQSLMLPIMKIAGDGAEHRGHELRQRIGEQLGLTEEERKQLLPSGSKSVFTNRIAWARSHLTMAGLLEKTGKGRFRITQRGKEALSSNPSTINMQFLLQFPEYAEARSRAKTEPVDVVAEARVSESASPQERI